MIKADIVISWPRNCDYPLWRKYIASNINRFNKVIIVITETNQGYDYSEFIKQEMKDCIVVKSPPVTNGEDWRNVSTNYGLTFSNSDWVWFTEQDFYPKDEFWKYINSLDDNNPEINVIGAYQGDRLHPCCIFIRRDLLNRTRCNFSITPSVADHFYKLQQDLQNIPIVRLSATLYEHLNGLSHNFSLISKGEKPNYEVRRFDQYLIESLESGMNLHEEFIKVCKSYFEGK